MAATALAQEKVWFDKPTYDKAACQHFERLAKGLPNVIIALANFAKVVAAKILEHQHFEPSPKKIITNVSSQGVTSAANEQSLNSSKKSKDNNNKAAKRHRNLKKSKSDAVDTKEHQTNVQQESQQSICPIIPASGSLANEIAKARQHIKKSLQCMNGIAACTDVSMQNVLARFDSLEKDNQELRNSVKELKDIVQQLEKKVNANSWPQMAVCPAKVPVATLIPEAKAEEGDDDVDLFGSDSEGEDAEAAKIREERVAAYAAKKSKKPALIAKSNIILDVKPWSDETDMKLMESEVRKIQCDGLLWGAAKLVPLAFGIHKLQISCVVEDDKVSVDWLTEAIQEIEEYVQSTDIAAFNKV